MNTAMPPLTFPCPFCGRRMGVGQHLLGRKVRCPHCQQVLLAPAPNAGSPVGPVGPVGQSEPPDLEDPLVIRPPVREPAESILSDPDESEDEVFGGGGRTKLQFPDLPNAPTVPGFHATPASGVHPGGPGSTDVLPFVMPVVLPPGASPPGNSVGAPPPTAVPIGQSQPPPVDTFEDLAAPAAPSTVPPFGAETPLVVPGGTNPWDNFDEPAVADAGPTPEAPSATARRLAAAQPGRGWKLATFALAGYALLATALVVYALFVRSPGRPAGPHPLSTLPDNYGEFPPAERKKIGKAPVPLGGDLPPELRTGLGRKLEIGQVEVEPLGVEVRPLKIVTVGKGGAMDREREPGRAVVLRLRVRNTSDDLTFHPLDPAFTRKAAGNDRPATGLVVEKQTFWGGAIPWPFPPRVLREYEAAQERDAVPLRPGEAREYVVFTDVRPDVVKAVRGASGPLLWRVQIRRGLVPYNAREVPVTAVIGVEFRPSDVTGLE